MRILFTNERLVHDIFGQFMFQLSLLMAVSYCMVQTEDRQNLGLFPFLWHVMPVPTKLAWVTWLAVWMEYAYTMRCVWVCALPSLGSLVHVTDCCVFVCAWGVSCEDVVFFFLCSWCGALTRPFPWKPGPEPVGLWRVSCFEALKRRLGKWVLWYTVFCCWVGLT